MISTFICNIFYLTGIVIVIGCLALDTLYCSHETLHLSIVEPTVYLQISGNQTVHYYNMHLEYFIYTLYNQVLNKIKSAVTISSRKVHV